MRLLAVDAGNTSIHAALFERGRWRSHLRLSTRLPDAALARALDRHRAFGRALHVAVASVVPAKSRFLKRYFARRGRRCVIVGRDIPVSIVNRYKKPRQVGVDRLLNALAAYRLVKRELVVVDFGTAITFDVVSGRGEYLGGVIAPGIEISLEALFERTALLPRTRLEHPKNRIGRDTVESIRVGCSVGIGGLCDRIVGEIAARRRPKPVVLATGGYASFMKRYCRTLGRVVPDLSLDGIRLAWAASAEKSSR